MELNIELDSDKASFLEPLLSNYPILYFKHHASSSVLPFIIEMLQKLLNYDGCRGLSFRDLTLLIITLRLTSCCFNLQTELSFKILSRAFVIWFVFIKIYKLQLQSYFEYHNLHDQRGFLFWNRPKKQRLIGYIKININTF